MNMKKPMIGITAITAFDEKFHSQRVTYTEAVRMAGGDAVLLPSNPDKSNCAQIVSMLDGLIAPGGPDIDPELYGENAREVAIRWREKRIQPVLMRFKNLSKHISNFCKD